MKSSFSLAPLGLFALSALITSVSAECVDLLVQPSDDPLSDLAGVLNAHKLSQNVEQLAVGLTNKGQMSLLADLFRDVKITTCDKSATIHVNNFPNDVEISKGDVTFGINQGEFKGISGPLWPMLLSQAENKITSEETAAITDEDGNLVNCKNKDVTGLCNLAALQSKVTGVKMSILHLFLRNGQDPHGTPILRHLANGGHKDMVSMVTRNSPDPGNEERRVLTKFNDDFTVGYLFLNDPRNVRTIELDKIIFEEPLRGKAFLLFPAYMKL